MKNISIAFVAALSLASFGCKKKGGDCGRAIANSMEVSKADMAKMPGVDDKMLEKMRDLGVQHCKDDKWSDEVVKCMSDSKTQTDAQGCYGKMTPDQKDKMSKAMMETMMPPGGAGAPAGSAAPGSAAAGGTEGAGGAGGAMGSDTGAAGSAAAGSAPAGGDMSGSAAAPK